MIVEGVLGAQQNWDWLNTVTMTPDDRFAISGGGDNILWKDFALSAWRCPYLLHCVCARGVDVQRVKIQDTGRNIVNMCGEWPLVIGLATCPLPI